MIRQIVRDYETIVEIETGNYNFNGDSAAEKRLIFYVFNDNTRAVKVLDIGFGLGSLGALIKNNPETAHWQVDGIDGFEVSCKNTKLFDKRYYRNIWNGSAQELRPENLREYDVLCLLDVIEHLDIETARTLMRTLLSSLREDAFLFISTPLWFYPQDSQQEGDLEEHLIGVPASSLMALQPVMYTMGQALVGSFIFSRKSLDYVGLFHPLTDKSFSIDRGILVATSVGMKLEPGVVYKVG